MKEYVERAAVKDEILSWAVCINHSELLSKEDTMYCIDNIPAADVVEERHGRWVDENKNPIPWDECNSKCPSHSAYCSECGEWLTGSDEYPAIGLYCPNCGARMDKEDEQ